MAVERTTPPALKRQYPHVSEVKDWTAQQSLRLLWDRIFDLEARLQAAESTVEDLTDAANTTEAQLTRVDHKADEALAIAQRTATETEDALAGSVLPGGGDGGEGAAGCADAGVDGHAAAPGLTAREAGVIICGTGNEFPGLLDAAVDDATRLAECEELLLRCIWHLQQAGFTAGRQRNPSGLLSNDKLTVIVDGITRCYDIFGINPFADPITMHMIEIGGPNMVADAGTAD